MLVGKLPFRSPRQGTKRRQKLLEQITNGLSESHEKELAHVSSGARDLIGCLLQPDPRKRVRLEEVMQHPWVTKDGSHPLYPYQEQPIDQSTKNAVSSVILTVTHNHAAIEFWSFSIYIPDSGLNFVYGLDSIIQVT